MNNGNRKIVCLLLIICIFFTGVCLENIRTESGLVYPSESENKSAVLQTKNIVKPLDHCTVRKIFLHKSNHIQKSGHYITKKVETKLLSHLLCSEHFSLFWENLIKSSEKMTSYRVSSKELVMLYIQKSDGKKKI